MDVVMAVVQGLWKRAVVTLMLMSLWLLLWLRVCGGWWL